NCRWSNLRREAEMFSRPKGASGLLLAASCACAALVAHFLVAPAATAQVAAAPGQAKKESLDEKTIRALIAQLGDDSFVKREQAQKGLAAIGHPALDLLRQAAKEGTDLETRERAAKLVQDIGQVLFRAVLKDKHWGDSVDPDGDCNFRLDVAKLHIKVPG